MYNVIENIIDHIWQTGTSYNSTEQQIIYYIAGTVIILITVYVLDLIHHVIFSAAGKK